MKMKMKADSLSYFNRVGKRVISYPRGKEQHEEFLKAQARCLRVMAEDIQKKKILTKEFLGACTLGKTILIVEPEDRYLSDINWIIEDEESREIRAIVLKKEIAELGFNLDYATRSERAMKKVDELGQKIGAAIVKVNFSAGKIWGPDMGAAVIAYIKKNVPDAKILAHEYKSHNEGWKKEKDLTLTMSTCELEEFLEYVREFRGICKICCPSL